MKGNQCKNQKNHGERSALLFDNQETIRQSMVTNFLSVATKVLGGQERSQDSYEGGGLMKAMFKAVLLVDSKGLETQLATAL